MSDTKSPLSSKINWTVVIATIIQILALTQFRDVIPEGWIKWIIVVEAILLLVFRNFFTSKPTTEYGSEHGE
jgi:hypothetical protein